MYMDFREQEVANGIGAEGLRGQWKEVKTERSEQIMWGLKIH
jgi:hypothetical protein